MDTTTRVLIEHAIIRIDRDIERLDADAAEAIDKLTDLQSQKKRARAQRDALTRDLALLNAEHQRLNDELERRSALKGR